MKNGTALLLYCHLKILENRAAPQNVLGQFLTELFGLPAVERPGEIFQNVMVPGKPSTPVYGIIDNIFRVLSLDAELTELSIDASIVQAHQHSAGAKKGCLQTKSDIAEVEQAQKSMP